MSEGKAIAQAGHAYFDAYLDAVDVDPNLAQAYASLKPGTKIALKGGSAQHLQDLFDTCRSEGIPCAVVIDSGHVEAPHFDGSPILTAIGIGPVCRDRARPLLSRLQLWPGKGGGS